MSLDPVVQQRIQALLEAHPVVLFMKGTPRAPQCGFSARTVQALAAIGLDDYHAVDVLADADIREGIKLHGNWPTIPQLYIHGELVGGSDIVGQMADSGELQSALGLPPPDRTPPSIEVTPAAIAMLRDAIDNAGEGIAVQVQLDPQYQARLQLVPAETNAIATSVDGVRLQFDLASARRASGLSIDWADDERGRGLVIVHPSAPKPVRELAPEAARTMLADQRVTIVDVRPPQERALAELPHPHRTLDDGIDALESLPKDAPIAFICHHGGRSAQAAEHFRGLGFREVYNVTGGIDAWAQIDPAISRY
ncbi:Grx4 family monothiol glutaredoxin [Pseudoluteimonas lycopersici]|uniref:Grx4 family monothiol glutaredoxin n=1 Tax=Pseudoluteimonas lycopersici TaxID=1324796 RepID=A0A516V5Q1_9GAMM|nr:Grx4 family monothiol glutaredoxin [Lysobacter lycopersici]QDQ73853.1 Grx4 family monothiol glutaredoxin [Lysobacter lycopersici]